MAKSFKDLPVATGSPAFEKRVQELQDRINSQIPPEARLPAAILQNLPDNVIDIPETCGLLTTKEIDITRLDTTALAEKIAAKSLTSYETTVAFCKRAAIAHQLVHCLTDLFVQDALKRAQELDEYLQTNGKTTGPLHGVPVSIKDHMSVAGRPASGGFLANLTEPQIDGVQVGLLREAGAVFYCKTTQPQVIMHLECHSFWGRTLNPYNRNLTPGGSSGGAAALIALKGACMSPGTDIGGSIRNPCAHCGIYGMRWTARTSSLIGHLACGGACDTVLCSTGPMCNSARDVALFTRIIMDSNPALRDVDCIPRAWSPVDLNGRKLKVGVMLHDDVVMPHPPMLRALIHATQVLEKLPNVEIVSYKAYNHLEGSQICHELYFPDGGKDVRRLLVEAGEDMLELTKFILDKPTKPHDMTELMFDLLARRDNYRARYSRHWLESGIDILLCPPYQGSAPPHDTSKYWAYTSVWNLVDYPGYVFPSGLSVDPALDKAVANFKAMSSKDSENNALYDAEAMQGCPISLQLVGRRFEDQMVIAAQKIIEDALKSGLKG